MKDATAKKVTAFNVVGIDPSRYWMDGYGYWTEDGKVYEDAVLVTLTKEDAFWVSVTCGQLCFLHVDMETQNPNGYLLEEAEAVLKDLFERGDVTGYTVITNPSRLEGIPECFSVLSKEEAEKLGVIRWRLRPVYYEFVYTKQME
jgi:hypothetical protein